MADGNGFSEWKNFILPELEHHGKLHEKQNKKLDEITSTLGDIRTDLAALKVKAGLWGLLGGALPVCIGFGVWLLKTISA